MRSNSGSVYVVKFEYMLRVAVNDDMTEEGDHAHYIVNTKNNDSAVQALRNKALCPFL